MRNIHWFIQSSFVFMHGKLWKLSFKMWYLKCLDVTLVRIYYLIVCLMQNCAPDRNRTSDLFPLGPAPFPGEWLCTKLSYRNTRKNPLRSQFIHQTVFCLLCMPTLLWLWNHERKQCYNVTNIGQRESILVSDRALVLRSRSYKQSTFFLGFHVFFLRRFEWFLKCTESLPRKGSWT